MRRHGSWYSKIKETSKPYISVREYIQAMRDAGFGLYEAMDDLDRRATRAGYDGPAFYHILCDVYVDWQPEQERKRRCKYVPWDHSNEEWEEKKAQYNYSCFYCGVKPKVLTRDHVIPRSQGGSDKIENIVPACWPCNRRKNRRPVAEFKEGVSFKLL